MAGTISRREALQRLGLEDRANDAEIKSAYRRLAVQHHPDKNPDNPDAAKERFIEVTDAYNTLTSSARAELEDLGLRGPEAFTSRLARWAQEIGGEARARKEEQREKWRKEDAEREAERQKRQEQLRKEYREDYGKNRSERKKNSSSKPEEGRFMTLEELSEKITREERYDKSSGKRTTSPLKPDASTAARYQEWEYHPQPRTKPIHPKPETKLSTEEKIRHYYKQAEDWVLRETGSGLALDIIVNRIIGKHKVADGEIDERIAQAVVYTKRVLYHEVKTIPKEEIAETSRTIAQARSIEQLLVTGSAVQMILSEWDEGRGTLVLVDNLQPAERDYSQPRRYGLFFRSTYQALLPHCKGPEDISRVAKVIEAAFEYEHTQNSFQENAEEIANLIATAITDASLEFAEQVLRIAKHSLGTRYSANIGPKKGISRQYQTIKDSLDSIIAKGYTPEEVSEILSFVDCIQGYNQTQLSIRSLKQFAEVINVFTEIIPKDKFTLAQRLIGPLAVGGRGYSQDSLERAASSWRNIGSEVLPFYESFDECKSTLFNRAMVAIEQLRGRNYDPERNLDFSWTKEIKPTIEAAAYGGKLIVEEALRCPDPNRVIEEFSNFLREYRYSEFFPIRRKKDWMPLTPTAKQREAYTYLSELQNKHNGAPLKLSPDQLGKVIEIYFR